jgi:hypothetical protein
MDKRLSVLLGLVCGLAAGATAADFPRLRHVNYLALDGAPAAPAVLVLRCAATELGLE